MSSPQMHENVRLLRRGLSHRRAAGGQHEIQREKGKQYCSHGMSSCGLSPSPVDGEIAGPDLVTTVVARARRPAESLEGVRRSRTIGLWSYVGARPITVLERRDPAAPAQGDQLRRRRAARSARTWPCRRSRRPAPGGRGPPVASQGRRREPTYKPPPQPHERDHDGDEGKVSELDADVEQQQRERDVPLRQPDLAQAAREAQPVQQTEAERDEPRLPLRQRQARRRRPMLSHDLGAPRTRCSARSPPRPGGGGTCTNPSAARVSVTLCATVNAVTVFTSGRSRVTSSSSPSTNSR